MTVSADTLRMLEACTEWARRTGGVFQPLVGGALIAWGYRKSLLETEAFTAASPAPHPLEGRIEIDHGRGTVRDPARQPARPGRDRQELDGRTGGRALCARCDEPRR